MGADIPESLVCGTGLRFVRDVCQKFSVATNLAEILLHPPLKIFHSFAFDYVISKKKMTIYA